MNEQLKFSWGHIIAFLTLILLCYTTFVGVVYKTDGDFTKASVRTIVIAIFLLAFFIGAQMAKATTRRFARRIRVERFLIFGSPIAYILCMMPSCHFATVHSQNDEIVTCFTNAISASKQMFADYETYSAKRIENYEHMLDRVISNRSIQPQKFTACGFEKGKEQIQKGNMVKSLRLQLLSENYNLLKAEAIKWIDASNKSASTWNPFLLGNTKQIKASIHDWNDQLAGFADHKMNNEEFNGYNKVENFNDASESLTLVYSGLDGLTNKFTQTAFPPILFVPFIIVFYVFLLLPYLLQDRHTKNWCRLLGEKPYSNDNMPIVDYEEESEPSVPIKYSSQEDNDDDYTPFTM